GGVALRCAPPLRFAPLQINRVPFSSCIIKRPQLVLSRHHSRLYLGRAAPLKPNPTAFKMVDTARNIAAAETDENNNELLPADSAESKEPNAIVVSEIREKLQN